MSQFDAETELKRILEDAAPHIRKFAEPSPYGEQLHRRWETAGLTGADFEARKALAALDSATRALWGEHARVVGSSSRIWSIAYHDIRIAMAERICAGEDPAIVATEAADFCLGRTAETEHVVALAGIHVSENVRVAENITIQEPASLRPSVMKEKYFGLNAENKTTGISAVASAAIVFTFARSKVLFDDGEIDQGEFVSRYGSTIYDEVNRIISTCALSGAPSTAFAASYELIIHPALGYSFGPSYAEPLVGPRKWLPRDTLNTDDFQIYFEKVKKFEDWTALRQAIDRYQRSIREVEVSDKAVDLGVALETALTLREKSEVSNKLTTRGAWYVGLNAKHRFEVYSTLKQFYNVRSTAAHSGSVKDGDKVKIEAAYPIALLILRKMADAGKKPDWDHVVLDFKPNHAELPA